MDFVHCVRLNYPFCQFTFIGQTPTKVHASFSQRLNSTQTGTPIRTTPPLDLENQLSKPEERKFLSDDEIDSLDLEQQHFMIRKRKAAMGLGPVMPESCKCPRCSGIGTLICHQCGGSGSNAEGKLASKFNSDGVRILNGVAKVNWFLMDNGPCWLCKGLTTVGCSDCSGTGIKGGVDRYTGD